MTEAPPFVRAANYRSGSGAPKAGAHFENRVRDILRRKGFFAMKSPASKSPIDLVAIKDGLAYFVQAKVNGKLPYAEWNTLWEAAQAAGVPALLVERPEPRKVVWWRLTGPKEYRSRHYPREPWSPDDPAV